MVTNLFANKKVEKSLVNNYFRLLPFGLKNFSIDTDYATQWTFKI